MGALRYPGTQCPGFRAQPARAQPEAAGGVAKRVSYIRKSRFRGSELGEPSEPYIICSKILISGTQVAWCKWCKSELHRYSYTLVRESFTLSPMQDVTLLKVFQAKAVSLEQLLTHMSKWGKPRLSKQDSGWYCAIEVFVTPTGVQFKVDSEFDNKTPHDASCQCYDRLIKAIVELTT